VASVRQAATINKMKAIDQALMAYRVANNASRAQAILLSKPGATNFGVRRVARPCATTGTGVVYRLNALDTRFHRLRCQYGSGAGR